MPDLVVLAARTFVEACTRAPEPCAEEKLRTQGLDGAEGEDAVVAAGLLAGEVLVVALPKIDQLGHRAAALIAWYLLLPAVQCR